MEEMKMGSLFDGSGGFPLAAVLCGIKPVWASEIEPFPIKVTRARFPDMKHYGDISQMNGAELEPVDLITGGSPCQDMSIAGKRAGLDGERSCLFRDQIRIVKEMREATNGQYPKFMLWENVTGAFSSNKGEDFRAVLEETARIKDESVVIPKPPKGKWENSGLVMGDGYSIAWRVFDAQYWGVPQRRRRIALVADFGGECAGKILFEREGLSRNFTESRQAWQRVTGSASEGIGEADEHAIFSLDREAMNAGYEFDRAPGVDEIGIAYTLKATGPGGVAHPGPQYAVDFGRVADRIQMNPDKSVTLQGEGGGCGAKTGLYCLPKEPVVMNERQYACTISEGVANTLTGTDFKGTQCVFEPVTMQIRCGKEGGGKGALLQHDKSATLGCNNTQTLFQPKCYGIGSYDSNGMKSDNPHSGIYEAETSRTLDLNGGNPACNQGGIAVCEPIAYSLQGNMIGREDYNGPQGSGVNEDVSFTLNATDRHAVAKLCRMEAFGQYSESEEASTIKSRDYKDATDLVVEPEYIVRRLTPLECCRLQGFPDCWTKGIEIENPSEEELCFWREVFEEHRKIVTGASKPKTDKQIIKWLQESHNDGAEYKMWGNGIALPCFLYVMEGIANVLNKERCNGQPFVCEFQRGVCCYPIEDCENCPVRKEL